MKKKILLCLLLVCLLVSGVLIPYMFKDTSQYNIKLQEESIVVQINPKVMYNTDNIGNVIEVVHLNEDAKIYKEEDFIGLFINDAIGKTILIAEQNGYVDEDTVVNVSSLNPNSVYLEDIVLNLKGNKINVKTEKLSQDVIDIIMSNIDTTGKVDTEITVEDDEYVIIKKEETIEGPEEQDGGVNNEGDIDVSESNGYGDYIEGSYITPIEGGPTVFVFYDTSKLGCVDAKDKIACANWWINDQTPRMNEYKKSIDGFIVTRDYHNSLIPIVEEDIKEFEKKLEKERSKDIPDNSYISMLEEGLNNLKNELITHQKMVKDCQIEIDARNIGLNEYKKLIALYSSILN